MDGELWTGDSRNLTLPGFQDFRISGFQSLGIADSQGLTLPEADGAVEPSPERTPAADPVIDAAFAKELIAKAAPVAKVEGTLQDLFAAFAAGYQGGKRSLTVWSKAVKNWSAMWGGLRMCRSIASTPISEPPYYGITAGHLDMVRLYLARVVSPQTANTRLARIRGLLRWAHLQGWRGPVPDCARLPAPRGDAKVWLSAEQFRALLDACRVASWPVYRGTSPAHQWRSLIAFRCCYGPRVHECFALRPAHRPLLWSNLVRPGRTPLAMGQCSWDQGWLSYVPQKQERKKPGPVVLPLLPSIRRWLNELQPRALDPEYPIWTWPRSAELYQQTWAEIRTEAARLSAEPFFERLQFEQLRESAGTLHYQLSRSEKIAEAVLGHCPRDVSGTHYVSLEKTLCEHFGDSRLAEYFRWP